MRESDKILQRLLTLHPKIIDLSLDRMLDILERMGNPQNKLPPVIHVAGTNGKGSTIAYLRSALEAANLSIHVYTSPHLVRFAERIRLNGKIIDEEYLTEILEHCEKINDGRPITYFEITTAAAFKAFAENPADALILEVGLGGRLDATNVIDKPISTIITPISLDHEQFLGNNIHLIATEKAGIIKENTPLIVAKQDHSTEKRIFEIAEKKNANLIENWGFEKTDNGFRYRDKFGTLDLPKPNLAGAHQISNAANAVAALRHQKSLTINPEHFTQGLQKAKWPARMQNITQCHIGQMLPKGSELWLDGGHNPAAGKIIADHFEHNDFILICGMLKNKDISGFLEPLSPITKQLYAVDIEGEISHSSADIVKRAWSLKMNAEPAESVESAIKKMDGSNPVKVLICGSLHLAGQVMNDNNLIPD